MAVTGSGKIALWEGGSLWLVTASRETTETGAHSHHAIQITFQLDGLIEIESNGENVSGPVVAVASDTSHLLRASGAAAALLFIEPESIAGRSLAQGLFRQNTVVSLKGERAISYIDELKRCIDDPDNQSDLVKLGQKIVADFAAATVPAKPDHRVRAMIDYARDRLEDRVTLPDAAAHINLSDSRARHLFAAHTGLPFKTYILWLRMERAVQLYAAGSSLTEAAHQAGFADSAHFSRTFRRTFGLAASALRLEAIASPD